MTVKELNKQLKILKDDDDIIIDINGEAKFFTVFSSKQDGRLYITVELGDV
jgi:hypothetical protein